MKLTLKQLIRDWWHSLWCGGYWSINVKAQEAECGFCGAVFPCDSSVFSLICF